MERRFALRVCLLLYYGIREIDEEAGPHHWRLRELCRPALRIGEAALAALAAIPDTPELIASDRAFLAAHPPRLDRAAAGVAAAMGWAWRELSQLLDRRQMDRIERAIAAAREAAGEMPQARCRTGMFERLLLLLPSGDASLNSA